MVPGRIKEKLINRIVAAATEALTLEELGRDALLPLEQLLGAGRLLLYSSSSEQPFVAKAGSSDCLPEYAAEFAAVDPIQDFLRQENPALFAAGHWRDWSSFRGHRVFRDFYDRWDLSWLFHIRLNETGHMDPGYAAIVCGRSGKLPDFDAEDLRAAAAVLPALAAAVRRSGRVAARLSSAAAIEALFERGQARAVLAMDLRGEVLWISAQAEKLLSPFLGGRRRLPDSLRLAARRLGEVAQGRYLPTRGPAIFNEVISRQDGVPLEAEVYLARTADGDPFVAVDLGGAGIPAGLFELARSRGLTRTETEVLSDLARGQSDAEIASRRFISIPTVRTHVTRVIQKFGVHSRLQAVALALGTVPRNSAG
ncbi:MAG TPA: helix-turn-helix transcriptional regulator [bacterium]|nr:helix-turn-helix transcriptional regulator [bacterium]